MIFPESPEAFCASLKAERLRQGLNLAAISKATKISESHFAALERGDLRNWPKGIFRRAFFSDYVRALNLPIEPALTIFSQLFPDDTSPPPPAGTATRRSHVESPAGEPLTTSGLRLSLAPSPLLDRDTIPRARTAALDALLVVIAAIVVSRAAPDAAGWIVALTALIYYSVLEVLGIDGPAARLLAWARRPAWPRLPRIGLSRLAQLPQRARSQLSRLPDLPQLSRPQPSQLPRPPVERGVESLRNAGRLAAGWVSHVIDRVRTGVSHGLDRVRELDMSGASDALSRVGTWAHQALVRAGAMTRHLRPIRENAASLDEPDLADRLRPARSDDGSQPRYERRMSPRTRPRSQPPEVRVRIRVRRD